jgi:hypothetical protein
VTLYVYVTTERPSCASYILSLIIRFAPRYQISVSGRLASRENLEGRQLGPDPIATVDAESSASALALVSSAFPDSSAYPPFPCDTAEGALLRQKQLR